MKKILLIFNFSMIFCNIHAQGDSCERIFVATSEKAMYELIEQLQDSILQADYYSRKYDSQSDFSMSYYEGMESIDTLMIAKRNCRRNILGYLEYGNWYQVYLSSKMPIIFYEKLFYYFENLIKSDNLYIKREAVSAISLISGILIEQYELGRIIKADSLKAKDLIELTILSRIVNYKDLFCISYYFSDRYGDKYMTKKIREALVEIIESPYYPSYYLDFYMSRQDTSFLDITDIPDEFIRNYKISHSYPKSPEREYASRLNLFRYYEELSNSKYRGISPGQAYLEERKEKCMYNGYMGIGYIEQYAYKNQDKLLIKHLKAFKKKHPNYTLKYF
jgi:hypothetical protein